MFLPISSQKVHQYNHYMSRVRTGQSKRVSSPQHITQAAKRLGSTVNYKNFRVTPKQQHFSASPTTLPFGKDALIMGCDKRTATPINCSSVTCPIPTCANLTTSPGECCRSCEGSCCLVKGSVNYRQGKMTWQFDPCIFCQCLDDCSMCAKVSCIHRCLGFPVITKPWE